MAKWTGDNRRKSEWWKLFLIAGGVSAVSVATGYAAHPNIPEPVEPEAIVIPVYDEELDSALSQLAVLTAREPEVRTVIIYRDTGSTIYDSIPYAVLSPPEIIRDSFPYMVYDTVWTQPTIITIPAPPRNFVSHGLLGIGGGVLGYLLRSLIDGGSSDTTLGRRPCAADRPMCDAHD